jgi:polygalacturonase
MKLNSFFFYLSFILVSAIRLCADVGDFTVAQPIIPKGSVNLKDFGAISDGKTDNAGAFKQAVEVLIKRGGGTLIVPEGVWYTLPFELASNINLNLAANAKILFSPHFEDYKVKAKKYRPLLYIHDAHDIVISGKGTIDGNGSAWWPEALRFKQEATRLHSSSNTSPRPRMVQFDHCLRVRVEDVTLINSPVFNLVPMLCEDVTIDHVTIYNPHTALNTDGIDPSASKRVLITHCTIDTGDDCIAVKAGSASGVLTENIIITDCAFGHGHGCSIGSETYSGLRHMIVRRCTFDGTEIGVRFKSDRRRGGLVEDVTYEDLTMRNVGEAIVISSYYQGTTTDIGSDGGSQNAEAITRTTPHWKHITVKNLKAVNGTKDAGMILGLPEMPAEAITLENVSIEAPKGLRMGYTKNVTLNAVHITAQGSALIADKTNVGLQQTK